MHELRWFQHFVDECCHKQISFSIENICTWRQDIVYIYNVLRVCLRFIELTYVNEFHIKSTYTKAWSRGLWPSYSRDFNNNYLILLAQLVLNYNQNRSVSYASQYMSLNNLYFINWNNIPNNCSLHIAMT